jgi:hypothetical protein
MESITSSKPCLGLIILSFVLLTSVNVIAQNEVAIGSSTTKSNAILWLNGNGSQGLILPVVTDKSAVSNPDKGMIVYDNTDNKVWYRNNSTWVEVGAGVGSSANLNLQLQGNALQLRDGTTVLNSSNLSSGTPADGTFLIFTGGAWQAASLIGDVAGANGSLIVNGIKGKTLPALPSSAQVLVYDGTAWKFQALTGGTDSQDLSLNTTTNSLSLTNDATPVDLTPYKQNLTLTGSTLGISGGNTVTLPASGSGTVTSISAGTGLNTGGNPITATGTIGIAPGGVDSNELKDGSVTGAKIASSAVSNGNIASNANIDISKLNGGGASNNNKVLKVVGGVVTYANDEIGVAGTGDMLKSTYDANNNNVVDLATTVSTNANLTGPVTSTGNATAIANGAITNAMLANPAVGDLSGTNTGDQINITGNAATVTTNANLTGPVTSTGNATAIANGAITNAMLANPAVANLSGNNTGDEVVFSSGTDGLVPAPGASTGRVLRDDGTWFTPAGSGDMTKSTYDADNSGVVDLATTVTTNANLTGPVTSTGNATSIANGAITNAMLANPAVANLSGINTGDQINITGNAGTATALANGRTIGITGDVTYTSPTFNGNSNVTGTSTVTRINGTSLAGLSTGLLKNTTGTGVPSIATGADLPTMTSTLGGAVPTPPNNTTTFLRGDGTFATPAGGGDLLAANNLSELTNAATARTNLSLGALSTLNTVSGANLDPAISINTTGSITTTGASTLAATTVTSLTGAGTRMVVADAAGLLSSQAIPAGATTNNLTTATAGVSIVNGTGAVNGTLPVAVDIQNATAAQPGLLTAADFSTFNNKGNGTVTTLSVATANGISGTVANPTTTPAITLTLGAITPASVVATGTVSGSNLSGTNTGDEVVFSSGADGLVPAPGPSTGRVLRDDGIWVTPAGSGDMLKSTYDSNSDNVVDLASTVTTNANLTGPVTSTGNATAIANGAITNAMLANPSVANLSGTNTGDQINITGNASTVTTNANLTGPVTSTGNATAIANGAITNAMLATISTAGKVDGGAINTGTIGGITAINTTGNIITTGVSTLAATTVTSLTGAAGQFVVDAAGNITKLNNLTTSFPSAQGAPGTVLTNDGAGVLTWAASTTGWGLTGNDISATPTNFIGTTSNNPLIFSTNTNGGGGERMRIDATGNVGIGTNEPQATLHINNAAPRLTLSNSAINNTNGAQLGEIWFNDAIASNPQAGIRVFRDGAASGDAPTAMAFYTTKTGFTTNSEQMRLDKDGNLTIAGGNTIIGNVQFYGALMPNNLPGTAGQVLTSAGVGLPPTWSAAGGSSFSTLNTIPKGDGSALVASSIFDNGNVGIGTTTPGFKLEVDGQGRFNSGLQVIGDVLVDASSLNNGTHEKALRFAGGGGEAIGSKATAGGNNSGLDFYTSYTNRMAITNGGNVGIGTTTPTAKLHVIGDAQISSGVNVSDYTRTDRLIAGTNATPYSNVQLSGKLRSTDLYTAYWEDVNGNLIWTVDGTGGSYMGGDATVIGGVNMGFGGYSNVQLAGRLSLSDQYFLWHEDISNVVKFWVDKFGSAAFAGNVSIGGSISKAGGTFKIDHPQDPENKWLYHSFVESPDMMNVYNGNIMTDAQGEATVSLPDYFNSLNKDFRYQLTVIGTFAQAIVFEEVSADNSFKIKTDKPDVKVSWQVTGIRKDPYAEKNRVVPEVNKSGDERGKYAHPEAYGLPTERGIGANTNKNFKPIKNKENGPDKPVKPVVQK